MSVNVMSEKHVPILSCGSQSKEILLQQNSERQIQYIKFKLMIS